MRKNWIRARHHPPSRWCHDVVAQPMAVANMTFGQVAGGLRLSSEVLFIVFQNLIW